MCRGIRVKDEWTTLCGRIWLRNRNLVQLFASFQMVVVFISFAQHIFSVAHFGKIFHCSFNESSHIDANFLQHDVIIFDFGLFHELIQVQECIANYLDGGYMRSLWCIGHAVALISALIVTQCIRNPHPLMLWPLLIMQNAYCFGLVILTIATADKLLVNILHPTNPHLNLLILYFGVGTGLNHIFDYVLWHYYWHEEAMYMQRTGKHVLPFWV
ncbi:hypothetical protein PENTCL1PPCAC_13745 [Pristionchus entomophagus]|uniref:G protein-coupled receptor n=1 Tax=Pristionchus entomophagus TaxID=358040 RepID=A0AAV5T8Y9_9BILA|nr:hypothetical protein PENTCL1PPCAC_13745 [Pristionchus entomophagus]